MNPNETPKTDKVIIYRSQWEADQDTFWHEHPQLALGLMGCGVLAIVLFWVGHMIERRKFMRNWRKF